MKISFYNIVNYKNCNAFNNIDLNFKGNARLLTETIKDTVSIKDDNFAKQILSNLDLKKSINNKNLLGTGSEGLVYRIENTNYVLKIPRFLPVSRNSMQMPKLNFFVTEQDRVNHIVAFADFITIMNYIEGINNSNGTDGLAEAINNLSIDGIKKYYLQLHNATKNEMKHDYYNSNTIVNPKTNELIAIDFWYDCKYIHYFNDFVIQCNKKGVNKIELLNKGLQSALELIVEEKIPPSEIKLELDEPSIMEYLNSSESFINYYRKINSLCKKYDKNPTVENAKSIVY